MFWTVTLSLLQGMRQAAVLFGLTLAFSLPLGLLVAVGSMSRCRPVRAVFDALVWVIRGTPLVLQLIIICYGPGLWCGHNIWGSNRMLACTVAASRPSRRVSGRPVRCWASPAARSSSKSPCFRW